MEWNKAVSDEVLRDKLDTMINRAQFYHLLAVRSKLLQLTPTAKVGQETNIKLKRKKN